MCERFPQTGSDHGKPFSGILCNNFHLEQKGTLNNINSVFKQTEHKLVSRGDNILVKKWSVFCHFIRIISQLDITI